MFKYAVILLYCLLVKSINVHYVHLFNNACGEDFQDAHCHLLPQVNILLHPVLVTAYQNEAERKYFYF